MSNTASPTFASQAWDLLNGGIGLYAGVETAKVNAQRDRELAKAALMANETDATNQANLIKWVVGAVVIGGIAAYLMRKK